MKQLFGKLGCDGFILFQTLIIFYVFITLYGNIVYFNYLKTTNDKLMDRALQRIDLEIAALLHYQSHPVRNNDAIYVDDHWITYYIKDNELKINFNGSYNYDLSFKINDDDYLSDRKVKLQ
ncbi:MAG: hypothetical protein GX845_01660 [Erysipelothrix sp.]|jgi:hypothetical protein|nr:hypothetical protein [Erysipelothrix sp.]